MTRPGPLVAGLLGDLIRSRRELVAENALLRQQLIVAARGMTRPAYRPHERGLVVLLARCVRVWPQAILLVRPETVLRWHREGFRLFWKWRSRRRPQPAEPRVSPSTIALIRRMADENLSGEPSAFAASSGNSASASRSEQSSGTFGAHDHRLPTVDNAGSRSCATTPFGPATSCRPTTSGSVPSSPARWPGLASTARLTAHGIYVMRFESGRIAEVRNNWDSLNVLEQLRAA
jgi:hypothetical protein